MNRCFIVGLLNVCTPDIPVRLTRSPLIRYSSFTPVNRVELIYDERYPSERKVAQQSPGHGNHSQFLLDDVTTSSNRVAQQDAVDASHGDHLHSKHNYFTS